MHGSDFEQRLSRMSTQWTLFLRAHAADAAAAAAGADLGRLVERYAGAVFRYLLGAVRDAEAAEELAQEFALRFLRGDFRRAHPERGRLRHYLKTVLVNLVNDHQRARQAGPGPLPVDTPDRAAGAEGEPDFTATWREELLERTWKSLGEANRSYHAALLLRVENPDMPSPELADALRVQLGRNINAGLARKTIQRAQGKFAQLLLEEVKRTLETPSDAEVKAELEELNLLRYCQSLLTPASTEGK